jgi:DNA-binding beta-propeller fold protein YncE
VDHLPGVEGVALDTTRGRNRAYAAGGNSLYIVDAGSVPPQILKAIDVGIGEDVGAHAVAYNPNTDLIYVTGYRDNTVTVVDAGTWRVLRRMTGFFEPSYLAVNTTTNKVYVSNHTGGAPWGYVSVISGTSTAAPNVYLSGDLYGLAVDSLHNRVYVASISAARVYVIDGRTDTTMGDIQIIRARDSRPVPLRMAQVNSGVVTDTHLWLTSSQGDLHGMDRLVLLSLPGSLWPPETPYILRSTPVASSPESGLVFDPNPASWRVFASSAASNLITLSQDKAALCADPLAATAVQEPDRWVVVTHDYRVRRHNR